jgi:Spy/CpxP family protein refolding chaperone
VKRTFRRVLIVLAIALPLVAIAAWAKGGSEGGHESKGRLLLVLRMAAELDLSDEKALAVSRALKQAEEQREQLRTKRRELHEQIREALGRRNPDDAMLSKLIDQTIELDRLRAKAMEDSFASLKKSLTVQEQAKLVLMRGRMHYRLGRRGDWHGGGEGRHH